MLVKDLELRITGSSSQNEQTVFLDNAYQAYKAAPSAGHDVINRYVTALVESVNTSSSELQRDRIVPIIKDRAWLEEIRAGVKPKGVNAAKLKQVWEDYNDDLVIVYAEDSPKNIRYLDSDDLAKIKLAPADLRELAVQNLRRLLPNVELRGSGDRYILTAGGDYEASFLLASQIWSSDQIKVPGEIVVAIPARDMLLITGSNSREGIAAVRKQAAEIARTAPYRLTPQLFVFRGGKFVPFKE